MIPKKSHVLAALLAASSLWACDSTQARIDDNVEAFDAYPAKVKAAIKANQIEKGFDHTQVFLALGKPSRTEATDSGERWIYHDTEARSVREEKSASEYQAEYEKYEEDKEKGHHATEPSTYHNVVQNRTRITRIVYFEDGFVTSWETPQMQFVDDWH